jgi:hypothetical protein
MNVRSPREFRRATGVLLGGSPQYGANSQDAGTEAPAPGPWPHRIRSETNCNAAQRPGRRHAGVAQVNALSVKVARNPLGGDGGHVFIREPVGGL